MPKRRRFKWDGTELEYFEKNKDELLKTVFTERKGRILRCSIYPKVTYIQDALKNKKWMSTLIHFTKKTYIIVFSIRINNLKCTIFCILEDWTFLNRGVKMVWG
jgi:hypothetical protein